MISVIILWVTASGSASAGPTWLEIRALIGLSPKSPSGAYRRLRDDFRGHHGNVNAREVQELLAIEINERQIAWAKLGLNPANDPKGFPLLDGLNESNLKFWIEREFTQREYIIHRDGQGHDWIFVFHRDGVMDVLKLEDFRANLVSGVKPDLEAGRAPLALVRRIDLLISCSGLFF